MTAIVLESVTHRYGTVAALQDLSIAVAPGEVVGIVGPNGAGKSTCLSIMSGSLEPTSGRAIAFGHSATTLDPATRRKIGAVPQDPALFGWLTLVEYVQAVTSAYGAARDDTHHRTLVAGLGLADAADRTLQGFSRGMQKKAHFAAMLAVSPPILVLDEPFDSIDTDAVLFLQDALQAHKDRGGTIIVSTHLLEVAAGLCHRVLLLAGGRLAGVVESANGEASLDPAELKRRYRRAVTTDPSASLVGIES